MIVKIIGLIIGLLVLGAGICYLVKEKQDPESRKIYTVVSVIVYLSAFSLVIRTLITGKPRSGASNANAEPPMNDPQNTKEGGEQAFLRCVRIPHQADGTGQVG